MSGLREALERQVIYSLQCSRIGVNVPDEQVAAMVLTGLDDQRPGWDAAAHPVEPAPHNTTHPVGRRSATGVHHADDCPMRSVGGTGCICGREGEREPAPVASQERVTEMLAAHSIECTGLGEVTCRGCRDLSWMSWRAYRTHVAAALLAAGVFRDEATVKAEGIERYMADCLGDPEADADMVQYAAELRSGERS